MVASSAVRSKALFAFLRFLRSRFGLWWNGFRLLRVGGTPQCKEYGEQQEKQGESEPGDIHCPPLGQNGNGNKNRYVTSSVQLLEFPVLLNCRP